MLCYLQHPIKQAVTCTVTFNPAPHIYNNIANWTHGIWTDAWHDNKSSKAIKTILCSDEGSLKLKPQILLLNTKQIP